MLFIGFLIAIASLMYSLTSMSFAFVITNITNIHDLRIRNICGERMNLSVAELVLYSAVILILGAIR